MGEEVAELVALDLKVGTVLVIGVGDKGDALYDLQAISVQPDELPWVVGHDANGREPQVSEDLRADAVVSEIRSKAESLVGLHSIGTTVLESVGPQLVEKSDAPPFLMR